MMRTNLTILVFLMALGMAIPAVAKQPDLYIRISPGLTPLGQPAMPPPQPVLEVDQTIQPLVETITLPAGTPLSVWLLTPLDTATAQPGQAVEARTTQPIYVETQLVLPEGLLLKGMVETVLPAAEGRNAILKVVFKQLVVGTGQTLAVQSHIKTGNPQHFWGGELTPGTERTTVQHGVLGIGYYNQEVLTGKRAMGVDFRRPMGDPLTIILDAPLQVPAVGTSLMAY